MKTALPKQGRATAEVLAELKGFAADDPDYKQGRLWSLVYYLDEDYAEFLGAAYQAILSGQRPEPDRLQEPQALRERNHRRHGRDASRHAGGLRRGHLGRHRELPAGGQDLPRPGAAQRGVTKPEMVLPVTAHVAWFKASEYFGVKVRLLPLDKDLRADVSKLHRADQPQHGDDSGLGAGVPARHHRPDRGIRRDRPEAQASRCTWMPASAASSCPSWR